jgi:hypothetical protein
MLVIGQTREAIVGQIHDETFVKKLKLTLAKIREQCTGA